MADRTMTVPAAYSNIIIRIDRKIQLMHATHLIYSSIHLPTIGISFRGCLADEPELLGISRFELTGQFPNERFMRFPLFSVHIHSSTFLRKICRLLEASFQLHVDLFPSTVIVALASEVIRPQDDLNVYRMESHLRILSLDGGGVRGLSSLYILKELMAQIWREYRVENPHAQAVVPRPCEYFDLICGTSTGGLIALMLGRLRMVKFVHDVVNDSLLTKSSRHTPHFPKRSSRATQETRNSMTTSWPPKSRQLSQIAASLLMPK